MEVSAWREVDYETLKPFPGRCVTDLLSKEQLLTQKVDVPPEHWDAMFAPSSCLVMVTTVDSQGRPNAASYGTCTRVNHDPVYIAFTTSPKSDNGSNVVETGEFVVNVVPFDKAMLEKVITVGLPFKKGINELEKAGLTGIPSRVVKPPRIAECPTHFECKMEWTKTWVNGNRIMVCGRVVAVSINKDCIDMDGYIVWDRVKPAHYCGAPYVNKFVPANQPLEVNRVYEGKEDEFKEGSNWRNSFRRSTQTR